MRVLLVALLAGCGASPERPKGPKGPVPYAPELLWEVDLGAAPRAAPVVHFDGGLWFGISEQLQVLSPDDGSVRFITALDAPLDNALAMGNSGSALLAVGGALLQVNNLGAREVLATLAAAASGGPALLNDGGTAVATLSSTEVYDANVQRWQQGGLGAAQLVVTQVGQVVRIGVDQTIGYDAVTGEVVWSAAQGGTLRGGVGSDDLLLVGGRSGLNALDTRDQGRLLWSSEFSSTAPSVAIAEGTVFVGGSAGVQALDEVSGEALWSNASDAITAGPILTEGLGLVAVDSSGKVLALDRLSGSLRWAWELGEAVSSAPLLLPDGVLVLSTDSGRVVALQTDLGGLCSACLWPRHGHDNRGTGRAGAPVQ